MLQTYIPESLKDKVNLLKHLHDIYYSDKLEFLPLMLESQLKKDFSDSLLHSYTAFKSTRPLYHLLEDRELSLNLSHSNLFLNSSHKKNAPSLKSESDSLISILTNPHTLASKKITTSFDLFEMKVIKQVIDQILEQLRA